jgi:hypothetical protein
MKPFQGKAVRSPWTRGDYPGLADEALSEQELPVPTTFLLLHWPMETSVQQRKLGMVAARYN